MNKTTFKHIKVAADVSGYTGEEDVITNADLNGMVKTGEIIILWRSGYRIVSFTREGHVLHYQIKNHEISIGPKLAIYLFHTASYMFFLLGNKVCGVETNSRFDNDSRLVVGVGRYKGSRNA